MSGAGQTYWGIEQWMLLLLIANSYALCLIVQSEKCSVNDKVSVFPGLRPLKAVGGSSIWALVSSVFLRVYIQMIENRK